MTTIQIPFDWAKMEPNGDFNAAALEQIGAEDPIGDHPCTRLYANVNIGGFGMHMEAIEVKRVTKQSHGQEWEEWVAVNESLQDEVDALNHYGKDYGEFRTHEINGREYFIIITPH